MAKDPYNPTVKAFKKNGLLEEILYPDGRPEGYNSNNRWLSYSLCMGECQWQRINACLTRPVSLCC